MRIALVGAELEENLGLRYMASALESRKHEVEIIPFNEASDIDNVVKAVLASNPDIAGLSMVFTCRAKEFCALAQRLRHAGYRGHITAGGPFASFNCERLLTDFPEFDTIALGEGEPFICALADKLQELSPMRGICYRDASGRPMVVANGDDSGRLDDLPWPKRIDFHAYFDKPIASMLTSRGCWRECAFCSINAWYERVGGKKFRVRTTHDIIEEMKDLYFRHAVRIFNFQDDNFFLPNSEKAARRFGEIRDGLRGAAVGDIAIAVKARPDSITEQSISILDELGLFRVFLGVENGCQNALQKLNRKNTIEQILNALRILNDYDVHVAFNLLMFEPHTVMSEILTNLRFIERHIDNPFNFCRAEAYAGTQLAAQLHDEGMLIGDYFGFDYRIVDPQSEVFHQIANHAFFERNFSDFGLHYFNMQVDFYFQLLRRFHPAVLTEALRADVKNFIKQTNLDTYERLCGIYDFVATADPRDRVAIEGFARLMRASVDAGSARLLRQGERILGVLEDAYKTGAAGKRPLRQPRLSEGLAFLRPRPVRYTGLDQLEELDLLTPEDDGSPLNFFGLASAPITYAALRSQLADREPGPGRPGNIGLE